MATTSGNSTRRDRKVLTRRELLIASAAALSTPLLDLAAPSDVRARPISDRVVIIGAGVSGLATARRLADRYGATAPGQLVVLEARNRIGGRIETDRSLGFPVDAGAAWIHGASRNPIRKLAETVAAQLEITDYDSLDLYDTDGTLIAPAQRDRVYDGAFTPAVKKARRSGYKRATDQSLAASLMDVGAGQNLSAADRRILDWHYFWDIELDRSFDLSQLSSWEFDSERAFRGPDMLFRDGYDQILPALSAGLDIRLDHVISHIDYSGDTIVVQTSHGPIEAERCVVTLPLGVLKAGSVAFTPSLPPVTAASIDRLGFGVGYKMVLRFPHVFWNPTAHFLGYSAAARGDSAEFLNMARYTGTPALLMNSTQNYATSLEAMTKGDATARVMTDLHAMFGPGIPDPTGVITTDWGASPYTGGSYSYWKVGSNRRDQRQLREPVDRKLFFAGEHTSHRYPGTVHGAYLSGLKTARLVRRHAR